eukprot:m.123614 g.123614  ORF g.123614 m.123614 type:complete len:698 (-) comp16595_c0_seq4:226-2319(-)
MSVARQHTSDTLVDYPSSSEDDEQAAIEGDCSSNAVSPLARPAPTIRTTSTHFSPLPALDLGQADGDVGNDLVDNADNDADNDADELWPTRVFRRKLTRPGTPTPSPDHLCDPRASSRSTSKRRSRSVSRSPLTIFAAGGARSQGLASPAMATPSPATSATTAPGPSTSIPTPATNRNTCAVMASEDTDTDDSQSDDGHTEAEPVRRRRRRAVIDTSDDSNVSDDDALDDIERYQPRRSGAPSPTVDMVVLDSDDGVSTRASDDSASEGADDVAPALRGRRLRAFVDSSDSGNSARESADEHDMASSARRLAGKTIAEHQSEHHDGSSDNSDNSLDDFIVDDEAEEDVEFDSGDDGDDSLDIGSADGSINISSMHPVDEDDHFAHLATALGGSDQDYDNDIVVDSSGEEKESVFFSCDDSADDENAGQLGGPSPKANTPSSRSPLRVRNGDTMGSLSTNTTTAKLSVKRSEAHSGKPAKKNQNWYYGEGIELRQHPTSGKARPIYHHDSASPTMFTTQSTFQKARDTCAHMWFSYFNAKVFGNKLPHFTPILWNKRLNTTAGRTVMWPKDKTRQNITIELSPKVIDNEKRLRLTLCHEMCHAAAWVIDGSIRPPHGSAFKRWARRAMSRIADMKVTTCHEYEINWKFKYECEQCYCHYGRHSKSIRLDVHRCGKCKGHLRLVKQFTQTSQGTIPQTT